MRLALAWHGPVGPFRDRYWCCAHHVDGRVDRTQVRPYDSLMSNRIREQRTASRGVRSVDHALAVLAAFQAGSPFLTLTELSQRLGLSKSSVHALLASLERGGLVSRDARPGKYG